MDIFLMSMPILREVHDVTISLRNIEHFCPSKN